jgi:integrase
MGRRRLPREDEGLGNTRGIFEKAPGSGIWWIRFNDAQGRYRREKAGTKGMAIDLALNTGLRLGEQYGMLWEHVSLPLRMLTIPRSKNGTMRHVPLNQTAVQALEILRKRLPASQYVCGGAREPRRWFEPVLKTAKIANFSWYWLRHTFASRLVMAGVDIRTVQELLGHKTIAMTVRYSHLAPKHTLAAVERLDTRTEIPTDTTTDTGVLQRPAMQSAVLQ